MTPGAQLLIAKEGSVIYQKSYGFHTYEKKNPVLNHNIYDLASLTKVLTTLPLIINEFKYNNINLKTSLKDLFPSEYLGDKSNLKIDEILSHYSRLSPWIPFYRETLDSIDNKQLSIHYSNNKTKDFNVKVLDDLYMKSWNDTIFKRIINSPLIDKK